MIYRILYIPLLLFCIACSTTEKEKYETFLHAEDFYIQHVQYGGIIGRHERTYHVKKGEFETLLIKNEGTDYQTFVRLTDKESLLKEFITEAYTTHDPHKTIIASCMVSTFDSEYILTKGFTTLSLKPEGKTDSLFHLLLDAK